MKADKELIYNAAKLTAKQADEIIQDALPIIEEIEEIDDLPKSTKRLFVAYERAKILFNMVKDVYKREYKAVDKLAVATAVLAIVYLVSPVDLIPDVIPGIGAVDDIAILSFAAGLCAKELERYDEFKNNQSVASGLAESISEDPYQ